ncbi:LysR family transcriptional regulator [Treponema sp.]|uniref:LysR family transcriptional regulator n=1 Tax=Treponema sp. TaxID=166 RepID=UPI003EFE5EDD
MELSQIRYFMEVARNEHVTKSAEILHVAQPALTQAIHRLEEELNVPLFKRTGRSIRLTPYGDWLYKKLLPLVNELNELPEQMKTMANLENSTIHLNVLAASSLVTSAIIEYKKTNKKIHIRLNQNDETDLYDICVTTKHFYKQDKNEKDSIFVCSEKIFLAVPNIPRFSGLKSISLAEVKNENFIALSGSKHLRTICDKYCQEAGIAPNIIFESDNISAVKNIIGANLGIGFWPQYSWGKLDTNKVLLLEISKPSCSRDILISYKRNKSDCSQTEKFYEFLTSYVKKASTAKHY